MSVSNVSPASFIGGTWTQIQNTFLLASGSSYAAGSTGGEASHTLSTSELPSHTHSVGAHAHGLNSHTHSIPALSGTAASNGNHAHYGKYEADGGSGTNRNRVYPSYATSGGTQSTLTNSTGAHTHAVTTTASITGAASGSTANSSAFNTGSIGSGVAHNNMPPYLAVYMWKRTA